MFHREFHVRFTLAGLVRFLFSPYFIVPAVVLVLVVPWGSEHAPAWVQAIGSVIGILIAVGIPAWQRKQDAKQRHVERMKMEHQNALMGLRACIEVDQFLAELKTRSSGNRFGWQDKEHFREWIIGLQQRLASLIDSEQNAEWWSLFLDAKRLLLDIDSALRIYEIDDPMINVLAKTHIETWDGRVAPARQFLIDVEEEHQDILLSNVWGRGKEAAD